MRTRRPTPRPRARSLSRSRSSPTLSPALSCPSTRSAQSQTRRDSLAVDDLPSFAFDCACALQQPRAGQLHFTNLETEAFDPIVLLLIITTTTPLSERSNARRDCIISRPLIVN